MSVKQARKQEIISTVDRVRIILADGVNVDSINLAKQELIGLCTKSHLFPRSDFPVPDKEQVERFFFVHEDENGEYALYVNSALPCQTYRPHNHGGSWAIIAAIEGEERHGLYREITPDTVELVNEIVVKPGTAVSMLGDGIHSISAQGEKPLLHLHFYGQSFESQGERSEYDLENGICEKIVMQDLDYIEDAR